MNWKVEPFGELDGRPVEQITLKNSAQCSMQLLAYGATLRSFVLPSGLDVCLGYDTLDAYRTSDGYLGATIGRNSNRIGGAWMELDGHRFRLTSNEGRNQLHGGYRGFHAHLWEFEILEDAVRFSRVSPDGEEGYPGTVQAAVTYQLLDDGFAIEYAAETDRDTLVNLTNHSYFNLAGQGNGTVLDHILQMPAATQFLPVDAEKTPIGLLSPVTGTALDFFGAARHWKSHRRRAGIASGRLRSRVRAVRKRRSSGREPVLPAHRRSFNGPHQYGQRTAVYGWRPCAAPRETRRRIWAIFGHLSGNPAVPKRHTGTRISLSTTACRRAIPAPVVLTVLLVTGDGEPTKLFAPV